MKIKLNNLYKTKIIFKNKIFFCQIGKKGIIPSFKKKEGDKFTPRGKWKINNIYYRKDKIKFFRRKQSLKNMYTVIRSNYIWSDNIYDYKYNKLISEKSKDKLEKSSEKLFRDDDVYDLVLEINYNMSPIIKGKGSAIFFHYSFPDNRPTNGCIAMNKNDLNFIINNLQKKNYIYIE